MKSVVKKIFIISILILLLVYIGYFIYLNVRDTGEISVLAYHHFMSKEEKEKYAKDNYNVISTEDFEKQLEYLQKNGYQSISADQLECYIKKTCKVPKKSVLITIDDGNISTYYKALPLLEKYGFKSLVFIITSRMNDETENWDASRYAFLGEDKVKEISTNHKSMAIGSHSHSLHDLINGQNPINVKSYEEVLNDVKYSKEILNCQYYAYPFGNQNEKYVKALKNAEYRMAFTFKDYKKASQNDDIYKVPRIEIRGDYSIKDFSDAVETKVSFLKYNRMLIKKIMHRE